MASMTRIVTRERLAIFGDALLMTAAAFGVIIGLSGLLIAPTGTPEPGTEWAAALSSILSLVVVVVVPVLVWIMHGRRVTIHAVVGGVLGALSAGFVFFAIVALSALLGLLLSPVTDSEFAGPIAMLVVVSAAFVALVFWLVVDAIRDLAPNRRANLRIDLLRLVSVVVLVALSVGVALWTFDRPGDESGEALVFAMVAGLGGALAVAGAETLTSLAAARKDSAPPAPVHT